MKHELLAPAGNIEAGYAALYYGADAVYLGLTKFSARAGAENFTFDELDEFTAYAHSLNRKVFVALNTILTETEIKELPDVFAGLKRCQVDALIIQDLGVFYLAKKLIPEIELHASTQMAVHNAEGARFLYNLGFKRVVLARELTKAEINAIAKAVPEVDLEVFVHGALCYSFSGQCLFSALEFGKSANRGRCAYPCRSAYLEKTGNTEENSHLFSMKDLALEEDVLSLNALSFKIEGRKKSPLYVAAAVNYYRHILDGKKKSEIEAEDIKQIFSRPWCKFHFNGKNKDIVDKSFVGHRGLNIGSIENIYKNKLCFKTNHQISRYDGLQIDVAGKEQPFGFSIQEMCVNKKSVFTAKPSDKVEIELPLDHPRLNLNAPVYLASSTAVKGKYAYTKPKPKEFVNKIPHPVRLEVLEDKIWAMSNTSAVCVEGTFEKAKDQTKVISAIQTAFAKTGTSAISFADIEISNPKGLFLPLSHLNELRRKLIEALELEAQNAPALTLPQLTPYQNQQSTPQTLEIIKLDLNTNPTSFAPETLQNAWFALPQICRNTKRLKTVIESLYQAGVRHFANENYYGFEILKSYPDITIGALSFIYVLNSYAAAALKEDLGAAWGTLALESSPLNMAEVIKASPLKLAQVTNGFPPLFTSAVCIRQNTCAACDHLPKTYDIAKAGKHYKGVAKDCMVQLFSKEPYQRDALQDVWGVIEAY
ncbi:MAG: U32 family peptidase [Alphaproteobacteria bacterium]|nr:U32 family peptidase [Alphaproteobacteria bacterium]